MKRYVESQGSDEDKVDRTAKAVNKIEDRKEQEQSGKCHMCGW